MGKKKLFRTRRLRTCLCYYAMPTYLLLLLSPPPCHALCVYVRIMRVLCVFFLGLVCAPDLCWLARAFFGARLRLILCVFGLRAPFVWLVCACFCFLLARAFFAFLLECAYLGLLCAWRVCSSSCWRSAAAVAAAVAVMTSSGFSPTGKSSAPLPPPMGNRWWTAGSPYWGGVQSAAQLLYHWRPPCFFLLGHPFPSPVFFFGLRRNNLWDVAPIPDYWGCTRTARTLLTDAGHKKCVFSMLGCRESRFQGTHLVPTNPSSAPPCPDGRGGLVWIQDPFRAPRDAGVDHLSLPRFSL